LAFGLLVNRHFKPKVFKLFFGGCVANFNDLQILIKFEQAKFFNRDADDQVGAMPCFV